MNTLMILCLAATLVAAVWAEGYVNSYKAPSYGKPTYKKPTYGGYEHKNVGYGHSKGGHGGYGGGKIVAAAPVAIGGALTIVDKLFERVRDVQDQVKTYTEQVDALNAQLSIQEKKLKELVLVTLVALNEIDKKQNSDIAKLDGHLNDIGADLGNLKAAISALSAANEGNTRLQLAAEILWATERATQVRQQRAIATLYTSIRTLKETLLQITNNAFAVFVNTVGTDTTLLGSIKNRENRRMCEVGQVTLDADDRKAEYQYQNWFTVIPQIKWGIIGVNIKIGGLEEPAHYGYGKPSYGYAVKEPRAIGLRVNGYSTKTGITLEAFDLSFGDPEAISVDVAFQACTIGPGTAKIYH